MTFRCTESHDFNPESVSERLTKKIGRQSRKPFSVFYDRLATSKEFVDKYEDIKYVHRKYVNLQNSQQKLHALFLFLQ